MYKGVLNLTLEDI